MNNSTTARGNEPVMLSPLIPVARLGTSDCPLGTAFRVCDEYVTPVPQQATELLGLEGTTVVQRWITLLIEGVPVVAATSYLPVEAVSSSTNHCQEWQDSDIGELALVGHTVTPMDMEHWSGPPTPGEANLFRMAGEDNAVTMLSRPYRVEVGEQSLTAGVILLAPCERLVVRAARRGVDSGRPMVWLVRESEEEDEGQNADAAEPVLEER